MKIKIESWKSFEYVEVREVTEYKEGYIFKTKHKGYAKATRPKQENEVYSSLSTKLTNQEWIELEIMDS